MIDERVTYLGPALVVTIAGAHVITSDLQIQPVQPPDAVVRAVEFLTQAVQYACYGIIGLAALAGLYFGIRQALGNWTRRKWLSAAGWVAGLGLFFLGLSGVGNTSLLVGAGIVSVWVGVIVLLLNEES